MLVALNEETGAVVNLGDPITSHRGTQGTLTYLTRARSDLGSGKIVTDEGREYYDNVYGLFVVDTSDGGQYLPQDGDHPVRAAWNILRK